MNNLNDLIERINLNYKSFSKGHKLLADYIEKNYDKAVFLTAASLGEVVGVSESTVVRFAMNLGYKGYPEFQSALEEMVKTKLNSIQRMEVSKEKLSNSDILEGVLREDEELIKDTRNFTDKRSFEKAVNILLEAEHVYVIGIRSCEPLAEFFAFYLNLIRKDVINLRTNSTNEIFEQMIHIQDKDAIVCISFPRYSKRTLMALEFARSRNAKTITLTDSINSPLNNYSTCNLLAKFNVTSFVDSLVAPLSIINALLTAVSFKKRNDVTKTLSFLEDIWKQYQVYENDEIEDKE
jgi:DNA-binding MurR/RpiR family transcriptional regulator